jgi:chromosomal replication initiator protein
MTANHETIWRDSCRVLQGMLNVDLFNRWFAPVHAIELSHNTLVLGVANEFSQIWLQENFLALVREAVTQASQQPLQVKFVVSSLSTTPLRSATPKVAPPEKSAPARPASDNKLNPRYIFESFVVGANNNFAHAAALAVSQSPAKAYNPLFVYGSSGLGKTHLMQAIGHYVASHARGSKVCYISCEQFTNDFIQAIQSSSLTKFRKKYRQVDLLLIDDIHFLAGKERMQEEFFHTFNTLFDAHKQLVLSSDRPAAEIPGLESRLVSRFEWGLVTELQPPDLETRHAILRQKLAAMDVKIPDQVLLFIAERIKTNIRRLEGALTRVACHASLLGKEIALDTVESLLRDSFHEEAKRAISIDAIQKKVAEHFDIRLADMTSRRRPQNVAFPRQVAMFLSRTLTARSLMDIGESFGGRDHGTVMHACRLIEQRMQEDEKLRQTVSYLQQSIQR